LDKLPGSREPVLASWAQRALLMAAATIVVFATVGAYWPTQGAHGLSPAIIHDFIKHHAVLLSLERRPLPLGNPFFADQATEPIYYYHFFYLIPATVRAAAPGLSIELAFGVQAALVALSLAGTATLLVKRVTGSAACATLAFLLTTVIGGLDIVPV